MNAPNMLTLLRIAMSPFFLLVLISGWPHQYGFSLLLFILACITDYLDGMLARKNGQITDFGKFLDPLADKMLTTAALLGLMQIGYCNIWVIMIILTREFLVISVRLVASGGGTVIAASLWGKLKTVAQMVAIIAILLMLELREVGMLAAGFPYGLIASVLLWTATFFTVVSGAQYVWTYRDHLKMGKD